MAPPKPATQLTRVQLYDLVWTKPRTALAKEFHVSDVAIAKACRKHGIPTPPLGYWAKLAHGKAATRPPLPSCANPALERVKFQPASAARDEDLLPDYHALIEYERQPQNAVVVPKSMPKRLHPLVEATKRALKGAPDERGIVAARGKDALNVSVSRASVPRAVRILNALVLAFEARGMRVRIVRDDRRSAPMHLVTETKIGILDEQLGFRLVEKVRRVERPATPREKQDAEKWPTLYGDRRYFKPVLTGELALESDTYGGPPRVRDGKKAKLEDRLNVFLVACVRRANESRRNQLDWEKRRRQDRELAEVEAARRAAEETKRRRLATLLEEVERWQQAKAIRAYLAAAREAHGADPGPEVIESLAWAEAQADRLDPLIASDSEP